MLMPRSARGLSDYTGVLGVSQHALIECHGSKPQMARDSFAVNPDFLVCSWSRDLRSCCLIDGRMG